MQKDETSFWLNNDLSELVDEITSSVVTKITLSNPETSMTEQQLYGIVGTISNVITTKITQNILEQIDVISAVAAELTKWKTEFLKQQKINSDIKQADKYEESIVFLQKLLPKLESFKLANSEGQPTIKKMVDANAISNSFSIRKSLVKV
jgi:hypothetical protein